MTGWLILAVIVFLAADLVLVAVWAGAHRAAGRLEDDMTTDDGFHLALLLTHQKPGRDPDRLLALAAAHRRSPDGPLDDDVPADPVESRLTSWLQQRIPGWSRRTGIRAWKLTVMASFAVSAAAFHGGAWVVLLQTRGPRPEWGTPEDPTASRYVIYLLFVQILAHGLYWLFHNGIERQWSHRVLRRCSEIVRAGLGDSYPAFVEDLSSDRNIRLTADKPQTGEQQPILLGTKQRGRARQTESRTRSDEQPVG